MLSKLLSSQRVIYNFILFISFSLSVNYFVDLKFINFLAYVIFHLTLIYLVFYFFNFYLFFISFAYGIFFDIFLINFISPHLISFVVFIFLFYYSKKYLLNFSSRVISYIIFVITISLFILQTFIANLLFPWLSFITLLNFVISRRKY